MYSEMQKYITMWDHLATVYHCPVIQNNFELPYYRVLGNREVSDIHGNVNYIMRLNMEFSEYAASHDNFYICDINYLSAEYGLSKWEDPFYWYMYKYALHVEAIPYLAFEIAKIIKSIFGKNKKGYVLDLDNTLWGGIIGEDGVDNIMLGPEDPEGQAYLEFQQYIKKHEGLGVLLNINSKNDYENAMSGLAHPDSVLSADDFICVKANWNPKDCNFREISDELALLPDSLVFVDDNPAERHIVREQLPGVQAPEIGELWTYIHNIDRNGFFEATILSVDDTSRNNMYKQNVQRNRLQRTFLDYNDYLRSLEMHGEIKAFSDVYMSRIAQLTNKSNQFNLTTKRYTQNEIEAVAKDSDYITLYGKLVDRFGDNGVVSVVIGHKREEECWIELWIMSCRVLKRDLEFAMMDTLVNRCRECGLRKIRGYYYPTAKNAMVKDFYGIQGFEKTSEDKDGNTEWILEINDDYESKNKVIKVED